MTTTNPQYRRRAVPAFAAALALGMFWCWPAQASPRKHRRVPMSQQPLPDRINALAQQLNGVQVIDAGAIPGEIQKLVLDSLSEWLNSDAATEPSSKYPLDVRVRAQLETYFSKLHYPFFGKPAVFVRPWKGRELIGAGYTLGWSDFDRANRVALFQRQAGKTTEAAVTQFVPGPTLHYAFLPPSPSGAFRFFVYGNRLGKSQPRMTAVLYSFDGSTLKELWERQDLYDGKIDVTPETVTLRYLIEHEYVQAVERNQLPPGHEAIYKVTPEGLALETEQVIPYKSVS
ncbi:MAG: hypothetical protein ACRD1N_11340 [Terriglobia bacterium]